MNYRRHPAAAILMISRAFWVSNVACADDIAQINSTATQQTETTLSSVKVKANVESNNAGYATRSSNSALGLDLSRRETPQSISVINRQQIEDFSLTGVNALLQQAPGINVESVETDRTYYSARGFEIQTFQFDGIGMPFSNGSQWGDLDTAVFERVDVLRGANGLLTSTGNPSATINFIRKRPTADFQASVAATVGSWDQKRAEGDISGALTDDGGVRGRLIAVKENKDSYLDRYSADKTVVSGNVDIDLGPDTVFNLGYTEQQNNSDSPLWGALPLHYSDGTPTHYDTSTSTSPNWAYWDNKDRRATAELLHQLGGGWLAQASLSQRKLDGTSQLFYVYGAPDKTTGEGLSYYPSAFEGHYNQSIADLRLSGPFNFAGRDHELLVGVNWGRDKAREHSEDGLGGDLGVDLATWDGNFPKPVFDIDGGGSSWLMIRRSAYTAARLSMTDAVKLIVGANITNIDSSGENYSVSHKYSDTKTTPYIGAVADLNESVSAYASYTRIFNPQTEVDVHYQVLDPIEGQSTEAGLKSEWLDKRLLGSIAIFRAQQDNTAQAAGTDANFKTYYKGVDATSTGFELELTGKLTDSWDINASYTQFRLVDNDGHDARTFEPRRTLKLATTTQVPGLSALKLGGALRYQSAISNSDDGPVIHQAAYAVVDLMAKYDFSQQWSVALNLDNVTDKKYLTSLYWTQAYYAEPRSLSATLRWIY